MIDDFCLIYDTFRFEPVPLIIDKDYQPLIDTEVGWVLDNQLVGKCEFRERRLGVITAQMSYLDADIIWHINRKWNFVLNLSSSVQ